MEKVVEFKDKKKRECGFDNIRDPEIKKKFIELTKVPTDATNFIFWFSKINPSEWGLTIKSVPKKDGELNKAFSSQHTWKITWFYDDKDGYSKLKVANHCKSLAADINGGPYEDILKLYNSYRKK